MVNSKKKMALHWKIIIGMGLGVFWALMSSYLGWNDFTEDWISPFGTIFLRLLKFIAIPMVLFSIINGVASLSDTSKLGRMGGRTLLFYLTTTVFAVGIGLILVNTIKPGTYASDSKRIENRISYEYWVGSKDGKIEFKDDLRFKDDPKYAKEAKIVAEKLKQKEAAKKDPKREKTATEKKLEKGKKAKAAKEGTGPLQALIDIIPANLIDPLQNPKNMLQVIFFAIFFGIVLVKIPEEKATPVKKVVDGLMEVFVKMVNIVMLAAPFFVFALMAGVLAKIANTPEEVLEIFKTLGVYSLVVVVGLAFMVFVFYPLLLKLFVKEIGYKEFFRKIGPAQLLAFSSSSSAATLPVTVDCLENNIGASKNVSNFVLPIGATVNMDGTSMYQAIGVIFLAQLHMIDLGISEQLMIVFLATMASIGAAAVPSAGLVMLMVVLSTVGLNEEWVAIIFAVDRILDMCRTVVNVTGDATVTTIIAKSENELNLNKQA